MEELMKELSNEKMGQVSGGTLRIAGSERVPTSIIKKDFLERKKEMQDLADIRMRASDEALKAAVNINRQEKDIKEAMKAQREELGL